MKLKTGLKAGIAHGADGAVIIIIDQSNASDVQVNQGNNSTTLG
jgi:hypothetical protein